MNVPSRIQNDDIRGPEVSNKDKAVIERNASMPGGASSKKPPSPHKRLGGKSWHGERAGMKSMLKYETDISSPIISRSAHRKSSRATARIVSPRSSDSSIKRILEPNALSPITPGTKATQDSTRDISARSKRRSFEGAAPSKKETVPPIYKLARNCLWTDFLSALRNSPQDLEFVYRKDGTNVLHMAVMSRTGYINAFKSGSRDFESAPHEILEEILQKQPKLALAKCTLNGYTPLNYACLVCSNKYNVEDGAEIVRLFLKYCPESIDVLTRDGLSPVDIHVVSYSHHHENKEDVSTLGRTSASVLRTLLTHSPELANNRIFGNRVKGPIELLYKCNSKAFSQAAMDEIDNLHEDGTVMSDYTIPERRQKVVDKVKKWWIWTWTVMILKYGSLKQKKRGAQFSAVHAASMQIACPTPILSITLSAFPRQIKQVILDKSDSGHLPLHSVCAWPCRDESGALLSFLEARKAQALQRLLQEDTEPIKVLNMNGETPLEIAAKAGTTWDGGIRRIVREYPKALRLQSKVTGLYPFMTVAAAGAGTYSGSEEQEAKILQTIYGLLRSQPKVLARALQKTSI